MITETTSCWLDAVGAGDAPDELRAWAISRRSLEHAWATCTRGDFLLWLASRLARTDADRRVAVLAACDCARTTLGYVPPEDARPLRAIEDAERWGRGEIVDAAEMNAALRAASEEADTEHAVAASAHEQAHDATAFAAVAAATSVGLAATWAAAGGFAEAVGSAAAAYAAAAGHAAAMATRIAHPEAGIAEANARLADLVRKRVPTPFI